ncbi:MAG: hypothetical protein LBV79_09330, partial [Candidatus Adiutrix sp.]|nr:hypothetical protein [Candidatus Adiutrix sp.]
MKCLSLFFRSCCMVAVFGSIAFADEIYQDADGVWRNRDAQGPQASKTILESVTEQVLTPPQESDEIYRDENGVWRNRTTKEDKPIADGLNSMSRGMVEGVIGIMDATVGEAARTSFGNLSESNQQELNELRSR